jgi:hypothetical protein
MAISLNKEGECMNDIRTKIYSAFKELGYDIVEIEGKKLYHRNGSYYRLTYIEAFRAYVIEYANSYEEAKNNVFEDGDTYSIDLEESEFIEKLKSDLLKYYC